MFLFPIAPLPITASSLGHFFLHLDLKPHTLLGFLLSHDRSFSAPLCGSFFSLHPGKVDPECRPGTSLFPLLSYTELQRSPENRRLNVGQSHSQGQTVKRGLLGRGQGGRGDLSSDRCGVSVSDDEAALEMEPGDGCPGMGATKRP